MHVLEGGNKYPQETLWKCVKSALGLAQSALPIQLGESCLSVRISGLASEIDEATFRYGLIPGTTLLSSYCLRRRLLLNVLLPLLSVVSLIENKHLLPNWTFAAEIIYLEKTNPCFESSPLSTFLSREGRVCLFRDQLPLPTSSVSSALLSTAPMDAADLRRIQAPSLLCLPVSGICFSLPLQK